MSRKYNKTGKTIKKTKKARVKNYYKKNNKKKSAFFKILEEYIEQINNEV